jgi:hypothetical protein
MPSLLLRPAHRNIDTRLNACALYALRFQLTAASRNINPTTLADCARNSRLLNDFLERL